MAAVVQIKLPPETASFTSGPGLEIANGQCLTCHSVEYVTTQPPMPSAFWAAEVKKMRQNYGANIPDDQVAPLVDYLARNYGAGTNAQPPVSTSLATNATSPAAQAVTVSGESLATRYGCLGCHQVSTKLVGPPYKDVAAKYSKDPNAYARISEQIHKGGSGKWGSVLMPPFPTITDAETKALANWILSRK